ncbi:MAG: UDP-N-acetylmuramoyl-L-alanine--D-glutamate ligase [Lachnospiraceae bacterium]|nr:UDP-N-acetylmuramoyl-L-alanine--D-glutamate ligase [Lachnospiraceae bacterium]
MNFKGLKVLIIGTGISGMGAAALLEKSEALPILFDSNPDVDVEKLKKELPEDTLTRIYTGELPPNVEKSVDLVILSPGVPVDIPLVNSFRERGIKIWGEIELGFRFAKGQLLAITGTNGKTTTTALLGQIMKDIARDPENVYIVGNIGNPYTLKAADTDDESVTVAEISSFQLETAINFKPHVSAILNITPDHLNRHHTMENYISIKESIAKNQTEDDYIVLNYDDPNTKAVADRVKAKVIFFSLKENPDTVDRKCDLLYMDGENIMYNDEFLLNVNDMQLIGSHNWENVMAGAGMALAVGVPKDDVVSTIKSFKAVEHRIEYVKTVNGVDYYNDSKGTNPDAAIKAVQAMKKRTVLIGGGYDKSSKYDEWIESFDGKVKSLILLGQTAQAIAECARAHGFNDIVFVNDMSEAVNEAHKIAQPGEAVLLSPACASWGMFKNYEERGRIFKDLVREL